MFTCERCGASFSPIRVAAMESCPRCRARDGVVAPLVFKAFAEVGEKDADTKTEKMDPRKPDAGKDERLV